MKTIKQIADQLGIDKQKVYRFIKNNHIKEDHQDHITKYYDEIAESHIISHFLKEQVSSEAHKIILFDAVVDTLQKELEIKNKQIEELTTALSETSKALRAAQALHVGTMQQQIEQKQSFFSWFKKR